jgi:hypothetical protein
MSDTRKQKLMTAYKHEKIAIKKLKLCVFHSSLQKKNTKQNIPLTICTNHFLGSLYDIKNNALYRQHIHPSASDLTATTLPV